MAAPPDDWNLLFGTLAVKLGATTPGALLAAQEAWVEMPDRPLSLILIERGDLAPADHARVEQAVRLHLARRGADLTQADAPTEIDPEEADFEIGTPRASDDALACTTAPDVLDRTEAGSPSLDETTVMASGTGTGTGTGNGTARPAGGREGHRPPGETSGPRFRAVRVHARGGLGEVSIAWDSELERHVALKEIRREIADRPSLRARFVREAEINGNLEHPGIVPVYGLGTHPDGRPYYAMRFVRGESLEAAIKRFHDQPADHRRTSRWSLELRQLLGHFLDVCDAIAYAHSRGVIHRDLKPANVLLGDYGESLIIDWGLAKVIGRDERGADPLDPREAEHTPWFASDTGPTSTLAGEALGSPPYMSPEQAAGRIDEVGRPSDVYGLGATLYAILTGVPPVDGRDTKEIIAKAARGQVTPPRSASPDVSPALAAVCLKALAREPADRYESALALADDVKRWLADEPVAVYSDLLATRVLRWSRRHRPLVAAVLAVLAVVVVGLALTTGIVNEQKRRAVLARDEAIAARMLARDHLRLGLDVVDQLVTLGDRQLIAQQRPGARNPFLESAVAFIHRFRQREPELPKTQFQTAELARRLANLYRLTGRFAEADALYDEAVALLDDLRRDQPSDPMPVELLSGTRLDRGEALLMRGRAAEADAEFAGALELAAELVRQDPTQNDFRRARARVLYLQSAARAARGRADAAEPAEESIALLRDLTVPDLSTARRQLQAGEVRPLLDLLDLVGALVRLAEARQAAGAIEDAAAALQDALERMDQVVARFTGLGIPDVDYYQPWVATRLARLRLDHQGGQGAIALLDPAIEGLEGVVGRYPEIWYFRTGLADARVARARARALGGQPVEAGADAEAARVELTTLREEFPDVPEHASLLAEAIGVLADLAPEADESRLLLDEAIRRQRSAVDINPESPVFRARLAAHQAARNELDAP